MKAYITLCTNDIYLLPCLVMYETGRQTDSKYDFYVLVSNVVSSTTKNILEKFGYKVLEVPYWIAEADNTNKTDPNILGSHNNGLKFDLFNLDQFEKLIYIDADSLFLQNVDELFDAPAMSAIENLTGTFCGGFFVLEPNKVLYKQLQDFIKTYVNINPAQTVHDEYILNSFFSDGSLHYELRLPSYYHRDLNLLNIDGWLKNYTKIKVIHYAGASKPGLYPNRSASIRNAYQKDNFVNSFGFDVYYEGINKCIKRLEDEDISLIFKGKRF